jgi:hypothetical protein
MDLTINDSNETFTTWLNKDFVTTELRELIADASILIVPFENLRETENPLMFPVGTDNLLRYFKDRLSEQGIIDICITDDIYQEFAFYSNYKRLGNFLVKSIFVTVFANILSDYIYDNFIKEDNTKPQIQIIDKSTNTTVNNHISELADKKYLEPTHVKFSVTVVDSVGKSKNISYEGPASEVDVVLNSLKEYEE